MRVIDRPSSSRRLAHILLLRSMFFGVLALAWGDRLADGSLCLIASCCQRSGPAWSSTPAERASLRPPTRFSAARQDMARSGYL